MICECCGHESRDGYKVNPETGRVSQFKFWCRCCYEAIAARAARDAYSGSSSKRPYDNAS
ncbi:hypothetical protein [Lacipirellula sp.]|uniref:hypothetical protein n=1 Tax=Lacipirellula sp. TaxID=2691419 RepID=UPI003D10F193